MRFGHSEVATKAVLTFLPLDRWSDRQQDRQTDRHTDRQTAGQPDIKTKVGRFTHNYTKIMRFGH